MRRLSLSVILLTLTLSASADEPPATNTDLATPAATTEIHIETPVSLVNPVICKRIAPTASYLKERICKTRAEWRSRPAIVQNDTRRAINSQKLDPIGQPSGN